MEKYYIEYGINRQLIKNKDEIELAKTKIYKNLTPSNIEKLKTVSLKIKDINEIINHFNINSNGKRLKIEKYNILINNLRLLYYVNKIKQYWKKYCIYTIKVLQGPAIFNRKLCNNNEDFLTTEKIEDIPYEHFFSFKDTDNFVYGFNLMSLKKMFNNNQYFNPYNRNSLNDKLIYNIKKSIRLNKLLKYGLEELEKENNIVVADNINNRLKMIALNVFHYIDSFGYYTQVEWYMDLSHRQTILFIRELYDIWNYRAGLTITDKIVFVLIQ